MRWYRVLESALTDSRRKLLEEALFLKAYISAGTRTLSMTTRGAEVIIAWEKASPQERAFWQRTIGDGEIEDGDFAQAVHLLERHQAIDTALAQAASYANDAIACLEAVPDDALREALGNAARFTIARTS